MSRYRVSLPTRADLREINRYIVRDRPQAAANLRRKLKTAFELLANRPGIGHRRADFFGQQDLQVWKVEKYLIVYENHPVKGVGIARVLHGSRDIASLLGEEPPTLD